MSTLAESAVRHLQETGDTAEAIAVLRGRKQPKSLDEGGGPAKKQTQRYFMPSQDALNQFILRIMDKLPDATYSVDDYANGSQAGYAVTVTGTFMDHDLASLAAVKGGVQRIDNPPANL